MVTPHVPSPGTLPSWLSAWTWCWRGRVLCPRLWGLGKDGDREREPKLCRRASKLEQCMIASFVPPCMSPWAVGHPLPFSPSTPSAQAITKGSAVPTIPARGPGWAFAQGSTLFSRGQEVKIDVKLGTAAFAPSVMPLVLLCIVRLVCVGTAYGRRARGPASCAAPRDISPRPVLLGPPRLHDATRPLSFPFIHPRLPIHPPRSSSRLCLSSVRGAAWVGRVCAGCV